MNEIWQSIPGFEGFYEASNLGRIRSVDRYLPHQIWPGLLRLWRGKILRPHLDGRGYLTVELGKNGIAVRRAVHRLVLETFVGARPDGFHACHCNGSKIDNQLLNLRWGTPAENAADKINHGTHLEGARHSMAKLSTGCVERMHDLRISGVNATDVATWFGVSRSAVTRATIGRSRFGVSPKNYKTRRTIGAT